VKNAVADVWTLPVQSDGRVYSSPSHYPGSGSFSPEPGFSVGGSFVDGGTLNITGTGFSTMGGDVIQYSRGDEGVNGQPIQGTAPSVGPVLTTFVGGIGADTTGRFLFFSDERTRGGRACSMRRKKDDGTGLLPLGGFGYAGINRTQLFVSFNRFASYSSTSGTVNLKTYYVYGNGTNTAPISEVPQPILHIPTGTNSWAMGANNSGSDPNVFYAPWTFESSLNAWQRWDNWLVLGTPAANATDGQFAVWRDNALGMNDSSFKWQGAMNVVATAFKDVRIGYMDANLVNFIVDYSDVYVADTLARVEVGNASTWDACTACEIQVARNANWSNTLIQATVNVGALGSLTGKYLYVIKSDGVAVKIGRFN